MRRGMTKCGDFPSRSSGLSLRYRLGRRKVEKKKTSLISYLSAGVPLYDI